MTRFVIESCSSMQRRTQITVVSVQCGIILIGLFLSGIFIRVHHVTFMNMGLDPGWIPWNLALVRWLVFAIPAGWVFLVHREAIVGGGLHEVPQAMSKLGVVLSVVVFLICAWEISCAMHYCFDPFAGPDQVLGETR